jgi:hypothetical protein
VGIASCRPSSTNSDTPARSSSTTRVAKTSPTDSLLRRRATNASACAEARSSYCSSSSRHSRDGPGGRASAPTTDAGRRTRAPSPTPRPHRGRLCRQTPAQRCSPAAPSCRSRVPADHQSPALARTNGIDERQQNVALATPTSQLGSSCRDERIGRYYTGGHVTRLRVPQSERPLGLFPGECEQSAPARDSTRHDHNKAKTTW